MRKILVLTLVCTGLFGLGAFAPAQAAVDRGYLVQRTDECTDQGGGITMCSDILYVSNSVFTPSGTGMYTTHMRGTLSLSDGSDTYTTSVNSMITSSMKEDPNAPGTYPPQTVAQVFNATYGVGTSECTETAHWQYANGVWNVETTSNTCF